MIKKETIIRIARPSADLEKIVKMYCEGLGFQILAKFKDHKGFDGIIIGHKNHLYHLEFTHYNRNIQNDIPSKDNLIVFYIEDIKEWENTCKAMANAGFKLVPSFNPYWDINGKTFEDIDGYRIVIQNGIWNI